MVDNYRSEGHSWQDGHHCLEPAPARALIQEGHSKPDELPRSTTWNYWHWELLSKEAKGNHSWETQDKNGPWKGVQRLRLGGHVAQWSLPSFLWNSSRSHFWYKQGIKVEGDWETHFRQGVGSTCTELYTVLELVVAGKRKGGYIQPRNICCPLSLVFVLQSSRSEISLLLLWFCLYTSRKYICRRVIYFFFLGLEIVYRNLGQDFFPYCFRSTIWVIFGNLNLDSSNQFLWNKKTPVKLLKWGTKHSWVLSFKVNRNTNTLSNPAHVLLLGLFPSSRLFISL